MASAKRLRYCKSWTGGFTGGCVLPPGNIGGQDIVASRSFTRGAHPVNGLLKRRIVVTGRGGCPAHQRSSRLLPTPSSPNSVCRHYVPLQELNSKPNRRGTDPYARWCGREGPRGFFLSRLFCCALLRGLGSGLGFRRSFFVGGWEWGVHKRLKSGSHFRRETAAASG